MTKRTRSTALEWLIGGQGGGIIMSGGLPDESQVRDAIGRFGPDAPDQNQSPVVWHANFSPTPGWRGATKEDCVPNTWMGDYPANLVEDTRRGEVIIRCPEKEARGARGSGSSKGKGTTYVNNLAYGPTYIYGGIVGNPSRTRGNGGVTGKRQGSSDGTAEYGGGSLTTLHNSPLPAYSGQQLYFSEVPLVVKDKHQTVLGNYFRYSFYGKNSNNMQVKLLPTLIALNAENVEQLQNGPLWELADQLLEYLKPSNISGNAELIRNFNKETMTRVITTNGFHTIPPMGPWLRINVLYDGLQRAFFGEHGSKGGHKASYSSAVKSLSSQLALEIQKFYIDEKRKMGRKLGGENRSLAMKFNERMPLDLDNKLVLDKTERDDEESGLTAEFHSAWRLLRRADHVKTTLHNQLHTWLRNHWMGTVTSPATQPGDQM